MTANFHLQQIITGDRIAEFRTFKNSLGVRSYHFLFWSNKTDDTWEQIRNLGTKI